MALTVWGTPRLLDLSVSVFLTDNGDARITETRTMMVEDTGTECYVVLEHLNDSRIEEVSVTDETDSLYTSRNPWDQTLSRSSKAFHWGLVRTENGYELCWGLGPSGERTYKTSYTVTALVRSYDDYDGFNYMFVADHLNPRAEHVKVVISKDGGFTGDEVKMWAFRFKGDINLVDSSIVAEAPDGLDDEHAMIVMLQFEKDVFRPSRKASGAFETVKERAFEGSDYESRSWKDVLAEVFAWLWLAIMWLAFPFLFLWKYFKIWRFRKAVDKNLMWCRDLPFNGNLLRANQVLNAMRYHGTNTKSLISACVLRLVSVGALRIEPMGDGSGKSALVIGLLQRVRGLDDTRQLRTLHRIFTEAASDDGILQPNELKKWLNDYKNRPLLVEFMAEATLQRDLKDLRTEMDECRKVVRLRLFLKDFTLANERHAVEVALWKDYLVYAELFGIAKQVRKDMQKVNPDYFRMDEVYASMFNSRELPAVLNVSLQGLMRTLRSMQSSSSRSGGGGGSASMGGGGGHSGGGSGGGIR